MENNFIPANYVPPASGGYSSFEQGENPFRILSNPIFCWLVWENKVCKRLPYLDAQGNVTEKPVVAAGDNNSVQHAWCVIAYNLKKNIIEILEITQKGLQTSLANYAKNPDWGHPKNYDVIIHKTGTGKEGTKYSLTVNPPKDVTDAVIQAYTDTPIDLNQLLVANGNPFLQSAGTPASTAPAAVAAKIVTPENWVAGDPVPAGYKVSDDGTSIKKSTPF